MAKPGVTTVGVAVSPEPTEPHSYPAEGLTDTRAHAPEPALTKRGSFIPLMRPGSGLPKKSPGPDYFIG
jgi:hypothetical protein